MLIDDFICKTNDYMNHAGCSVLRHTSEQLNLLGEKYFTEFFEPGEIKQIFKMATELIQSGDGSRVNSFYQRVRPDQHSPYEWYHMTTKLITDKNTPGAFQKMIMVGNRVNDMTAVVNKMNRLLEENLFASKNYHLLARLTKREKEILAQLALGLKNKDIAEQNFISEATVEQHRKNIKHKLGVKNLAELIRFALAYDLI
ncbi:helix-turn-helix transcriptional regulator [Adhaeribacter sp. BT258]|uniref:Helix-turn-helix transcriptional regulator n=2 Tax=Adhaeribacter terrigena TaxID=2793070 RepID=A0ABS1BX08_9BACT|nr:helix-turn-helix transcriptional regulator [Adhaeribacter terrigena]